MVDEREIQEILDNYFYITGRITIHEDGVVDIGANVRLIEKTEKLPVQFGHVVGSFDCYDNQLTSLSGSPKSVNGYFDCTKNKLTSLDGAPQSVGRKFDCSDNPLTSLKGAPSVIDGGFILDYIPNLPLLRTLVAKWGVILWQSKEYPPVAQQIQDVLKQFKGQGKRGFLLLV